VDEFRVNNLPDIRRDDERIFIHVGVDEFEVDPVTGKWYFEMYLNRDENDENTLDSSYEPLNIVVAH